MKTYKLEFSDFDTSKGMKIGDKVDVDFEYIMVVQILKIDFNDKAVWFAGAKVGDLY